MEQIKKINGEDYKIYSKLRKDIHAGCMDEIFIFGVGDYAKKLCCFYGYEDIVANVSCFLVSDKKDNPDLFMGLPVLDIESVQRNNNNSIVIMALAKDTRRNIEKKLRLLFPNVIMPEDFMKMSVFWGEDQKDRDKEIEEYFYFFQKNKPLFQYVEIETINRCNGECDFCPVNRFEKQRPYLKMEEKLFNKIIDELSELDYKGKVALFSNNEALLDKRIGKFAIYARKHLPKAYIYLDTNGTLLNQNNFLEIIDYIDALNLDIYKQDLSEKDPDNISEILELAKKLHIENKIHISRIDVHAIRSSRGGKSPNSKVDFTIKDKCPLPLIQMVIRPDGKVSLCCNDALGVFTLGDVSKERVLSIWNNQKFDALRKELMKGREHLNLCQYCDYVDMRKIE